MSGHLHVEFRIISGSYIEHLDAYADGHNGLVTYYAICLFHATDSDLARRYVNAELLEIRGQ